MGVTPRDLISKYAAQAQMSSFFVDRMGIINAKIYGAVPDTTNVSQTTKINDAVTAAKANGSEVVFFPAGVYYAATPLADSTSVIFVGDGASFSTQGSTYPIYQVWTPSIKTINNIEHHNADISMVAGSSDITVTPTTSYTVSFDIGTEIKNLSTTVAQHSSQIATLQTETTNLRTDLNAHTTDTSKHLNIMTAAGDMVYNSTAASPTATRLPIVAGKYLRSTTDAVPKPVWIDGPGADGAWESIASTTISTTTVFAVTINNPSTSYKRLRLFYITKNEYAGSMLDTKIYFNGDTSASYKLASLFAEPTTFALASTSAMENLIAVRGSYSDPSTNYGAAIVTADVTNLDSTAVARYGQTFSVESIAPSTISANDPCLRRIYGWYKTMGKAQKITSVTVEASGPSTFFTFGPGSYFSLWGA